MDMTLQQLGVDRLTVDERLELIGRIWDTLPDGAFVPPDWHLEELDTRLAAADADPEGGTPWEEVKARQARRP